MLLFPAADWGTETLTQNRNNATEPNTPEGWTAFLARTPYSQAAKDAIVRIQTDTTTDWMSVRHGRTLTADEKIQLLTRITYKQYLKFYVGAPEDAIVQYQRTSHGLLGAGVQAVSAADCWLLGQPGFDGLGLPDPEGLTFPGIGRTPQMDNMVGSEPSVAWPDGNTSLLRLLVSKLIPAAFPDVDGGRPNQENIVKAPCDYTQLDRPGNTVRIRLNCLVTGVKAAGRGDRHAEVVYTPVGGDGRPVGFRVRGTHVVMACWNRVTAHLVDDLPRRQVDDLCYARKVPLIYGRGVLNNWQAWADAKISSVSPRGKSLFWDSTSISAGARFGSAYGPTPNQPPSAPASLSFTVVPNDPSRVPQIAAYESGREQLLRDELRGPRGRADRRHRPQREQVRRRLRPRARPERADHQPLELRLRARADVGLGPVGLRARREPAARARSRPVPQRVDRQQRLGRDGLHAQRDQRGLPGDPGPARAAPAAPPAPPP